MQYLFVKIIRRIGWQDEWQQLGTCEKSDQNNWKGTIHKLCSAWQYDSIETDIKENQAALSFDITELQPFWDSCG